MIHQPLYFLLYYYLLVHDTRSDFITSIKVTLKGTYLHHNYNAQSSLITQLHALVIRSGSIMISHMWSYKNLHLLPEWLQNPQCELASWVRKTGAGWNCLSVFCLVLKILQQIFSQLYSFQKYYISGSVVMILVLFRNKWLKWAKPVSLPTEQHYYKLGIGNRF